MRKIGSTGLTLSELLLAVAILAFVLSGMIILFVNCLFLNEANRNLTQSISHAQYVMEDIKNTYFSGIKSMIDNGDWDWNTTDITANGLVALVNESIDTSRGLTNNPIEVTVSVQWEDRRQRPRQTELRTLITR
ncbi:MAG: hypothetical protein PVI33_03375 [Candidatus Omnitrophota bacterium]|jgi:hypothetical protein